MNYYLVIAQNKTVCAVYHYTNIDDALATYHTELAYRGEGRESTLCTILSEVGGVIKSELWERTEE